MTLGISALPKSLEPLELQCECVFIGDLLSRHSSLMAQKLWDLTSRYVPRTSWFTVSSNISANWKVNCDQDIRACSCYHELWVGYLRDCSMSDCLILRAYRDRISYNLRSEYCIPKSRDLLWDVCSSCRCIICVLIREGQFPGCTGWIRWASYRRLKPRAEYHYRSNHRSFLRHR